MNKQTKSITCEDVANLLNQCKQNAELNDKVNNLDADIDDIRDRLQRNDCKVSNLDGRMNYFDYVANVMTEKSSKCDSALREVDTLLDFTRNKIEDADIDGIKDDINTLKSVIKTVFWLNVIITASAVILTLMGK